MIDLGSNVNVEVESDVIGNSGPLESDVYDFNITMAYLSRSNSGAMAVNLTFENASKQKLRQQIYISSGDAKGNKFTYTSKDGKELPLPGYAQIDNLSKLAVDKPLKDLDQENKVIGIYDYSQKKEVPTEVPVLMDLLNQPITLGVFNVTEDKRAKNQEGNYVPTGETRTLNTIGKIFQADTHMTLSEIQAGDSKGTFFDKWKEKHKGTVVNKSKGLTGNVGSAPSMGIAPSVPTSDAKPVTSLFGQ